MTRRLISASPSEIHAMSKEELKDAIRSSEGRVVLEQNCVCYTPLLDSCTNAEIAAAMGADMLFFNGYPMDPASEIPGLKVTLMEDGKLVEHQYRVRDMKRLFPGPIGIYLECGEGDDGSVLMDAERREVRAERVASDENFYRAVEEGADFIILGGNPGTSTDVRRIVEITKKAKAAVGDEVMIWAGKWEDGVKHKVLGDPTADFDSKEIVKQLIDAGADVICLPMPGSRTGITVGDIRDLVTFAHTYGDGSTLVMNFLDGSIESSDTETVRSCAVMSKQTGADIHAIGDAGPSGMSTPEDIYQMTLSIKGRRLGWLRMATRCR